MIKINAQAHIDEVVSDAVYDAALARGKQAALLEIAANSVEYLQSARAFLIYFEDGAGIVLPIAHYPEFAALTDGELAEVELVAGIALRIDSRDLDVSVAGMISTSDALYRLALNIVTGRAE